LFSKSEIEKLEAEHSQAPHLRILQKALAKDITTRVHSEADYEMAASASEILFGKGTTESLKMLSETDLLTIMEGVPQLEISNQDLNQGINIVDLLAEKTNVFPSKGEAKKMIQGGGVSINKEKINETNLLVTEQLLLNNKYLLIQKGKKNYYLIRVTITN